MADQQLQGMGFPDVRTGTGFDVHRFGDGDHVWLGGIRIPQHKLEATPTPMWRCTL
ncbi:MAG: 2-C-methyl-D-erythritol 2,4-cyclodiphosphate synthase [Hyphomicrobiaceae bacterium]